jgi:hypothetical protein
MNDSVRLMISYLLYRHCPLLLGQLRGQQIGLCALMKGGRQPFGDTAADRFSSCRLRIACSSDGIERLAPHRDSIRLPTGRWKRHTQTIAK